MSLLLESTIRWSVLLLLVFAFCFFWRGSAAVRHLAWTFGAVTGLLFVVIGLLGPTWTLTLPWLQAAAADPVVTTKASSSSSGAPVAAAFFWPNLLLLGWLLGSLLLMGWTLLGVALSALLLREATEVRRPLPDVAEGICVRSSSRVSGPVTVGLLRPVIVVPKRALSWTPVRWDAALAHEAAHVRRKDVLIRCLGALVRAVHWPNPLAWVMLSRIRHEAEMAADESVLGLGVRPADYAELLLEENDYLGRGLGPLVSVSMNRGDLSRRIKWVLGRSRRAPPPRGYVAIGALLAMFFAVPAAIVTFVPPEAEPAETAGAAGDGADSSAVASAPRTIHARVGDLISERFDGISRIAISNPSSLDVRHPVDGEIVMEALAPGDSSVLIWLGGQEPAERLIVEVE